MQKLSLSAKLLIILCVTLFTSATITAQTFDPGGPGSLSGTPVTIDNNTSPTVPFDGGLSLMLIASGISYGAKQLRKKNQRVESE